MQVTISDPYRDKDEYKHLNMTESGFVPRARELVDNVQPSRPLHRSESRSSLIDSPPESIFVAYQSIVRVTGVISQKDSKDRRNLREVLNLHIQSIVVSSCNISTYVQDRLVSSSLILLFICLLIRLHMKYESFTISYDNLMRDSS